MLRDIQTYGGQMNIIKEAYDHSVKRAEFRADDHNLQIVVDVFQVIHTIPPQTVYQAPAAGSGAPAQADMTALPGGPSPGDHFGLADRQRAIDKLIYGRGIMLATRPDTETRAITRTFAVASASS